MLMYDLHKVVSTIHELIGLYVLHCQISERFLTHPHTQTHTKVLQTLVEK